ncbi:MAG: glucose-6-phosphate isomerase [Longimicrobiales bacterium]
MLRLETQNMLRPALGDHGIDPDWLNRLQGRLAEAHDDIRARRAAGALGFYELVNGGELVRIRQFADTIGSAWFDTVVVLGIGGSALGTTMLLNALRPPRWNELSDEEREYHPRLYVLDNIDPATLGPLLDRLDLGRTLFNVVSKSGATAETMAQYLVVRERLRRTLGDDAYARHLLFTTDPERGVLRRIAEQEGIGAFPIPPNVGGRFSVLSAVGLLPAALVGIDIEGVIDGARTMTERCDTADLDSNIAARYAALQYLAHDRLGAGIHVMMAYADALFAAADWFRQLWAESLGKRYDRGGQEVFRGPTPIKALGATDQHSQIQLYIEGPFDKTITFLALDDPGEDIAIPEAQYQDVDELAYLAGKTLGGLLRAEREATAQALTAEGRMNMTLELAALTPPAVGELLMMLQIATVFAGALYDVDPLDQPGVELGKQLTYRLMGRAGH